MSINPKPTHPRKTNRKSSPEHVDSIRNIETGIDKTNRLKKIRCYRGIRHETGQKVRGQRSRANGRSGMTVGVQRKRVLQQTQKKK